MLMNSHHSTVLECQHPYRKLIRALMTQWLERSVPTKGSNSEMAAQSSPILQASQQEPMGLKSKTVYRHAGG